MSTRLSAQVIPLPGAASEPVQQKRGPGRRPANIINLHYWRLDHTQPKQTPQVDFQTELENARSILQTFDRLFQGARRDFQLAQQRAGLGVDVMKSGSVRVMKCVSRPGAGT